MLAAPGGTPPPCSSPDRGAAPVPSLPAGGYLVELGAGAALEARFPLVSLAAESATFPPRASVYFETQSSRRCASQEPPPPPTPSPVSRQGGEFPQDPRKRLQERAANQPPPGQGARPEASALGTQPGAPSCCGMSQEPRPSPLSSGVLSVEKEDEKSSDNKNCPPGVVLG